MIPGPNCRMNCGLIVTGEWFNLFLWELQKKVCFQFLLVERKKKRSAKCLVKFIFVDEIARNVLLHTIMWYIYKYSFI